ncbi:MAG: YeeE/YedE family protein [Methylococcales bacterium]|nr:YeeE/YedE family protein [Methylococcaceae bacterium]
MKQIIACLFAGLLFGIGLALSSMIDPNKVLNFLDVAGNWDPSLAFVMIGALSVTFIAFHFIPKRAKPIFDDQFSLPTRTDIDKPLIIGAALFGIGWGMAGFCPGPALSTLGIGLLEPGIFVLSMLAGFVVQAYFYDKK